MGLPALCDELKLRADGLVPVVNSRDVAELFKKRHDHVLRDIDASLHSPELGDGWFREVFSEYATVTGRFDRSFDMTEEGFMFVALGWKGERSKR